MGHEVSNERIPLKKSKLNRIQQLLLLTTGGKLASFLVLCNFNKELVPTFAHVSDRLYKLSKITWKPLTAKLKDFFSALNQNLLQRPVVRLPNSKNDHILKTDASLGGVCAVLKLFFGDTNLKHTVAFFIRALTTTERNYSVYKLDMYAVRRRKAL